MCVMLELSLCGVPFNIYFYNFDVHVYCIIVLQYYMSIENTLKKWPFVVILAVGIFNQLDHFCRTQKYNLRNIIWLNKDWRVHKTRSNGTPATYRK